MADENEGAQGSAGSTEGAEGGNTSGDTSQTSTGAAGTPNGDADDASKGANVTAEELESVKARMKAADQRAARLEQELNERKRAEQDELTNTKQDLEAAQKTIADLRAAMDQTALENEFLKHNKYTWHDPADALALLNREGVEVKDGKVTGLGPAIEKLAKAKAHLLKSEADGQGGTGSSEASGSASNGNRKGSQGQPADTAKLASRFPALRKG